MQRDYLSPVRYLLLFIVTLLLLFSFTISSTLVPRHLIKEHIQESADYMVEQGTEHMILDFVRASFLDYYADSITLSIAYYFDEEHPVTSSMWANYYGVPSNVMPEYLKEAVENNSVPNMEYMRYWHGSASLMRIMHVLFNVKQIFLLNYVLMISLLSVLLIILWKNSLKAEAVCFIISMVSVSIWYVPLCLEYTYAILIMLASSIVAVRIGLKNDEKKIGPLFLITGMITVYFDFLTAETLTLLIPLLLIFRIRSKRGVIRNTRSEMFLCLKAGILWSIGYIGMWVMKWILATLILHQNMLPFITEHIAERLDGDVVPGLRPDNYIFETIIRNLKRLFPYEFGISGAILVFAFIVVLILPVIFNKVKIKPKINKCIILIYIVLAVVPFIRFALLHNHAYRHSIFTHRALAATVLAIGFIVLELVEKVNHSREEVISDA